MKTTLHIFIFILFLIVATGCNKAPDPIIGFEMGSFQKVWQNHTKSLIDQGIVQGEYDSHFFEYRIFLEDDSFDVEMYISDYNYYGKLISIDLEINRLAGDSKPSEISKLLRYWMDSYGEPEYSTIKIPNSDPIHIQNGKMI
jgi:hypothetical protein